MQELGALGWKEGGNLRVDWRWAGGDSALFERYAAELVALGPDILVVNASAGVAALRRQTSTIPIVGISGDPVQMGLVARLARPGGNLTGLAILTDELELKNLQLLKEVVPGVARVAVLWNPDNPVWTLTLKRLHEEAPTLGVKLQPLAVRGPGDLEAAFATATREKAGALVVFREGIFTPLRQRIVNFAATHRLPAIYGAQSFIEVGGLIVYAANFLDMLRRTGGYVDKILRGAKPADLPIEQPTRFELVINLKIAKTLGLTIPQTLLLRADQVIE